MGTAVYVETGVGGHTDDAVQVWTFEVDLWGLCGQGLTEQEAIDALRGPAWRSLRSFLHRHGEDCPPVADSSVAERVHGDERAFDRDRVPAREDELERTLQILEWARAELVHLLEDATDAELDYDDPERHLPAWATWRTPRQMAWHIVDTESRYYLPALGIEPPPRADDLWEELERSTAHVRRVLPTLPPDLSAEHSDQVWTTTKVLRRLAWHERGELDVMRELLDRARADGGTSRVPETPPPPPLDG